MNEQNSFKSTFSKSKATIEFDFYHQFTAEDTLGSLLTALRMPAIENIKVVKVEKEG